MPLQHILNSWQPDVAETGRLEQGQQVTVVEYLLPKLGDLTLIARTLDGDWFVARVVFLQ